MTRLVAILLFMIEFLGNLTFFAIRSLRAILESARRLPRESTRQFYRVLMGALPLGLVAGLAIGLVLWMHLRGVLERSPAGPTALQYLPTAIALAVTLEFAPIGAGLIVAGRTGASLGAELGAMKLTEQIDALEVMGLPAMRQLVGPRILACVVAMPILTILIIFVAISGAFGAELLAGSLNRLQYQEATWDGLRLEDVIPAIAKTSVFGFLIGLSGCYFGMTAKEGTEGVGHASTRSVELSIVLVLIANVVLVRVIQILA